MAYYLRNKSSIGTNETTPVGDGIYGLNQVRYINNNLDSLNTELLPYDDNTDVSTVISSFANLGYDVIATPVYNAMAELLIGTNTTILETGRFRYDLFDEVNELAVTTGLGDISDGHPWIGMAGFGGNTYLGMVVMSYTGYSSGTELKNLFYPNQSRSLEALYIPPTGYSNAVSYTNSSSGTWFSNNQQPGVNGYNTTSKFSADDGSWGFADGLIINGNGGPYISNSTGHFGINNSNALDSNASTLYWNGSSYGSTYKLYMFIQKV